VRIKRRLQLCAFAVKGQLDLAAFAPSADRGRKSVGEQNGVAFLQPPAGARQRQPAPPVDPLDQVCIYHHIPAHPVARRPHAFQSGR